MWPRVSPKPQTLIEPDYKLNRTNPDMGHTTNLDINPKNIKFNVHPNLNLNLHLDVNPILTSDLQTLNLKPHTLNLTP